jgi:hypothetical protein
LQLSNDLIADHFISDIIEQLAATKMHTVYHKPKPKCEVYVVWSEVLCEVHTSRMQSMNFWQHLSNVQNKNVATRENFASIKF